MNAKAQTHVRLQTGFYADWFHKHYGISFNKKYYLDPETRIEARMAMDKALHERFGTWVSGPRSETQAHHHGRHGHPSGDFRLRGGFEDEALPWAMPMNLSETGDETGGS